MDSSKTWHALLGSLPAHAYGPGVPTYGIQLGECNRTKIAALYERIQRIYPYYMPNEWPGVGSCYTSQRQALVKDFQRRAGINPSGIVGPKTWHALHKVVSASTGWTG